MKRIAVGVDGSVSSGAAIRWARTVADAVGADVVMVNALSSESQPDALELERDERRQELASAWSEATGAPADEATIVIEPGDAREVLLAAVDSYEADLLVLGRSGSGGQPGFLHLGSVVEHVAHHIAVPLAVIPASWDGSLGRVVLGVDGSDDSRRAIDWVTVVAPALGAEVVAVEVAEPFLEWTPASSPDNWRRGVEQRIQEWTSGLAAGGVEVTAIAQRDMQPANGLLGVAAGRFADLLVVGARGLGGFAGLRMGGVAMKVLHQASMPLVMVAHG
jgi:nucleotide-binding universal stress UspA family protein